MKNYLKRNPGMSEQELRQLEYREKYKDINPNWDDSLVILCKLYNEIHSKKEKTLDIGCGRANIVVEENRSIITEAVGIDIDPSATEGNTCLDKIFYGNVEVLPFEDNYFDVVFLQWVIEHLNDPEKVFKEAFRVLRPGGSLLFVTPYKYSIILIIKRLVGSRVTRWLLKLAYGREEKDVFETEYKANTPKSLVKQLENAGFKKEILIGNPDPSYVSLNQTLFKMSIFFERLLNVFPNSSTVHLIGRFVKKSN